MSLPDPVPGLVIRYSFLWSHEAEAGREEATKDRPCAIVLSARRARDGQVRIVVAPITHRPPADPADSIEIPPQVARGLGLDDGRHWLRVDELNGFLWPGFDLRPIPGKPRHVHYGMLPQELFERLRQTILAQRSAVKLQDRD